MSHLGSYFMPLLASRFMWMATLGIISRSLST